MTTQEILNAISVLNELLRNSSLTNLMSSDEHLTVKTKILDLVKMI